MNNEGQASGAEQNETSLETRLNKLEERTTSNERAIAELSTGLEALKSFIGELPPSDVASNIVQRVNELHARVEAITNPQKPSLLQAGLTPEQREVLELITALPNDAYAETQKLMANLNGQPMTEAFAKSLASVLKSKKMGVVCEKCGEVSGISWSTGSRYKEKGLARFIHTIPGKVQTVTHGSITTVRKLTFALRIDKRSSAQ